MDKSFIVFKYKTNIDRNIKPMYASFLDYRLGVIANNALPFINHKQLNTRLFKGINGSELIRMLYSPQLFYAYLSNKSLKKINTTLLERDSSSNIINKDSYNKLIKNNIDVLLKLLLPIGGSIIHKNKQYGIKYVEVEYPSHNMGNIIHYNNSLQNTPYYWAESNHNNSIIYNVNIFIDLKPYIKGDSEKISYTEKKNASCNSKFDHLKHSIRLISDPSAILVRNIKNEIPLNISELYI